MLLQTLSRGRLHRGWELVAAAKPAFTRLQKQQLGGASITSWRAWFTSSLISNCSSPSASAKVLILRPAQRTTLRHITGGLGDAHLPTIPLPCRYWTKCYLTTLEQMVLDRSAIVIAVVGRPRLLRPRRPLEGETLQPHREVTGFQYRAHDDLRAFAVGRR